MSDEHRTAYLPSLWLTVTPIATLAGLLLLPHVALSYFLGACVAFLGGSTSAVVPLSLSAKSRLGTRVAVGLTVAAAIALGGAALIGSKGIAAVAIVNAALALGAHAAGGSIGRRVQHPGHLLPACVVAAAADFASVLSPSGPTHAIVQSERALSVMAIGFAVPGTHAVAPVLGVGDLLFLALIFGVVAKHRLSLVRAGLLAMVGTVAAGGLAMTLERAVPALVPIGAVLCAGMPAARRMRPEDRTTARIAMVVAAAVVLSVLLRRS